jgi:hypothetical protein
MISDYYEQPASKISISLSPEEQIKDLKVPGKSTTGAHFLDTDEQTQRYFRMIKNWFVYEKMKQSDNRIERIKAHNYKDGDQWDEDDKDVVEARGQSALVFNRIKPACDWLIGTEKRTRVDYSILPRRKEESKQAEAKTKLLKYLSDVCKIGFARSLAFEDGVISGLGWLDHGISSDEMDEPLYVDYEDWRNVWHDSHAKKRDLSDGRYLFRSKIVDYDIAVAMFPDRADCIRTALNQNDDSIEDAYVETGVNPDDDDLAEMGDALNTDNHRDRVRLVSCEYRLPTKVKVLRGKDIGALEGNIYDAKNEGMAYLVNEGHASLYDAVKMVMWKMIFCGNFVLQNRKRIYNHQQFSLIPVWGYRKKKDNSPYGVVKNLIDPQDDLNKRRSKALFILSTKQSMAQETAIDDHDEFVEERDRPDGHMVVKDLQGVKLIEERALAKEHVMLMEQDAQYIEAASGVTDEARGIETNAISGVAMQSREKQAHVNTAEFFDNYRYAFQISGEIQISLIEQFYTDEKTFRLTGDKGQMDFIDINNKNDAGEIENDITATQTDFVVEADSYHATVRQAMFESFGNILSKLQPEIAIQLLDMWLDLSDLPGKEVMVERIRAINKQSDPDEDPDDPETQKRKAAEAEEAQRQQAIEDKLLELEMALKEAEVGEKEAEAEKDLADAEAKLAKIRNDIELTKIKKAETLNKIEVGERRPVAARKSS